MPSVYKGYVEGLRFAGFKQLLHELAWNCGLDITVAEDKGWIRSTYYYRTSPGTHEQINKFKRGLEQAIEEYNER